MKTLIALLICAASIAFGQESGKQDRFSTMDACVAAIQAGNFQYYKPSFLTAHREVRAGEVLIPLEEQACVNLRIVGGRGFVPQPKGEKFIFRGTQIVARYDCGNSAREIVYVVPVVVTPAAPPSVALCPCPEPVAPPPPPPPLPALAMCKLTGDLRNGFVGEAVNGTGTFTFDGQSPDGKEVVVEGDKLVVNDAAFGMHTVQYAVGDQVCEVKFDVFGGFQITEITPNIQIPHIGFCDTEHDGLRPDRMVVGMFEQLRCRPGGTIVTAAIGAGGGYLLGRAFPKGAGHSAPPPPPALVKTVPPGGVPSVPVRPR